MMVAAASAIVPATTRPIRIFKTCSFRLVMWIRPAPFPYFVGGEAITSLPVYTMRCR
jgi:hypothetical protein